MVINMESSGAEGVESPVVQGDSDELEELM